MYDPYTGRWLQELPRELARPNMQPRYEIVEVNGRKGAEALPMGPPAPVGMETGSLLLMQLQIMTV